MKLIALSILGLVSPFALVAPVGAAAQVVSTTPGLAAATQAKFADGTFTGVSASAYYGNIKVQVVVQGGLIAGFKLLDYPSHTGTSVAINRQALPILAQEVIAAQSVQVDFVSGATLSSDAFLRSVGSALKP
ncbi:MAG: FMN-binding protein [Devosia sp.]